MRKFLSWGEKKDPLPQRELVTWAMVSGAFAALAALLLTTAAVDALKYLSFIKPERVSPTLSDIAVSAVVGVALFLLGWFKLLPEIRRLQDELTAKESAASR